MKNLILLVMWTLFLLFLTMTSNAEEDSHLTIENILCEGFEKTSCELIKRNFYQSEGDILDFNEVENAKYRMSVSHLYDNVFISLRKGSEKGRIVVVIEGKDHNSHWMELTAGFLRYDYEEYDFDWHNYHDDTYTGKIKYVENNLFGKGKIFDMGLTFDRFNRSDKFGVEVDFSDPNLLGSKRYFLNTSLHYKFYNKKFLDNEFYFAKAEMGRRIWDFSYLILGSNINYNKYEYNYGTNYFRDRSRETVLNYYFNIGRNTQDDPIIPSQGSSLDFVSTYKALYHHTYCFDSSYYNYCSKDKDYWDDVDFHKKIVNTLKGRYNYPLNFGKGQENRHVLSLISDNGFNFFGDFWLSMKGQYSYITKRALSGESDRNSGFYFNYKLFDCAPSQTGRLDFLPMQLETGFKASMGEFDVVAFVAYAKREY